MLANLVKTGALMAVFSTLAVAAPAPDRSLVRRDAPGCTAEELTKTVLKKVNLHRNVHGSPDMEYDATLAKYAQGVSDTCTMEHSVRSRVET
jgi:uncharacterized protein YkwD